MTVRIDLDAELPETPSEPSVVFTLGGREWRCVNREAIDALTVEAVLMGRIQVGDFFRGVLFDDDVEDFMKLLDETPRAVSLTRYQRLANALVEEIFERPTERPGSSPTGPQSTPGTSEAVSSSRATPQKRRAS